MFSQHSCYCRISVTKIPGRNNVGEERLIWVSAPGARESTLRQLLPARVWGGGVHVLEDPNKAETAGGTESQALTSVRSTSVRYPLSPKDSIPSQSLAKQLGNTCLKCECRSEGLAQGYSACLCEQQDLSFNPRENRTDGRSLGSQVSSTSDGKLQVQ